MGAVAIQILFTLFIAVLVFTNSFATVWPSYALKILESEDSPLGYPITKNDGTLIGSLVMLGSVVSIIIAGYVNDKIGRKHSVILVSLLVALSWSIVATAKSVTQLLIGRLILGLSGGLQIVTVYITVSEITQVSLRGPLLSLACSLYNIGALASYIVGWFCSYEFINYLSLTIIVGYTIVASFLLKETPLYLMKIGKENDALLSLKFYRGTKTVTQEILDELAYIRSQLQQVCKNNNSSGFSDAKIIHEQEKLHPDDNIQEEQQTNTWKILVASKSSQRAILLLSVQIILAVCVGMIGMQAYAGQMFLKAVPGLSPDFCSVILALVMSITGVTSAFVTDRIPRRVLMISTCLMSSVCLIMLASLLRWSWAPEWVMPLVVVLYCIFFLLGVINVPFIQVAECVSPQLKSLSTTATMFSMFFANFLVLLFFKPAIDLIGLDGVFFTFSIVGVISAAMAYFFMRETRRVPFEDVCEMFDSYLYRRHKYSNVKINN